MIKLFLLTTFLLSAVAVANDSWSQVQVSGSKYQVTLTPVTSTPNHSSTLAYPFQVRVRTSNPERLLVSVGMIVNSLKNEICNFPPLVTSQEIEGVCYAIFTQPGKQQFFVDVFDLNFSKDRPVFTCDGNTMGCRGTFVVRAQ